MVMSYERYFQFLVFFTTCVFVFSQSGTNEFYNPVPIASNSYHRSGATRKSSIVNDISNYGQFTFKARYNHNQVEIDGTLLHHFNGTKELMITGLARVVLISKGFNTYSNGYFHTFDNYDQFENRDQCPPSSSVGGGALGPAAAPGFKTVQTILG